MLKKCNSFKICSKTRKLNRKNFSMLSLNLIFNNAKIAVLKNSVKKFYIICLELS